jgi:hypothetical protein
LAEASGVGITTIRTLEAGSIPRGDTLKKVCTALEGYGIEFTEGQGVRARNDELTVFAGPDSCEMFFDDMMRTVRETGSDVVVAAHSQSRLLRVLGVAHGCHDKLKRLGEITHLKCLLTGVAAPSPFPPSFHFRTINESYVGPSHNFVYGDRDVRVISRGTDGFQFTLTKSTGYAQASRLHLLTLWELATPFLIQVVPTRDYRSVNA